jgi:hypothetical protein
MSLIGGGGSGAGGASNPVSGSNPAGVGSSLNYVLNRVYAYSGTFASTGSNETTYLEFDTGSETIVGVFQFCYAQSSDDNYVYRVYMNDQQILSFHGRRAGGQEEEPAKAPMFVVIPAYSKMKATCQNETSGAGREQSVAFTGRIY